ncbi:MAG: TIGR04552 family protein [Bdellovibrionales bacterium]|nr:TIGR04552 family protein [Bdellovibrionales bacterium]
MNPGSTSKFDGKKYDFRWDVLDIIISGRSSIDSQQGFQVGSLEDAERFISSYGFNFENPIEKAEAFGHFHEALNFIRKYFLWPDNPEGLRLEIPRKVLELTDVRELLLMANYTLAGQSQDGPGTLLRNWACSILKVMHTIAHIDQDLRSGYFADIQQQILDRYYRAIHRDGEGQLYLGERDEDPARVDLVAFETKPKKSRESTLVKLLHKPENVAEDIFDRVGIRFVTPSRLQAIQVVKYLKDKMIILPPNIKPSRSRNTLVPLDVFRDSLAKGIAQVEAGKITESQLRAQVDDELIHLENDSSNPHSSKFYRAIQFTARQLVKLKNPIYDDLRELKSLGKDLRETDSVAAGKAARTIEKIDLKHIQREIRFFYPYEVQVVDQKSHEENEKGRSAHSEYKKAQVQTALRRVMGALVHGTRT